MRARPSWEQVKRDGYHPVATVYTNVVNQRLALPVTYAAARLGLSPNALTLASAFITAAACTWIVARQPGSLGEAMGAFLLLELGYVLDSSDGQLARVMGSGSRFGAWFDHFVDGTKIVVLNLCFGACLLLAEVDPRWAYAATASNVTFQSMLFFGSKLKVAHFGAKLSTQLGTPSRRVRLLSLPFEFLDWGLFVGFSLVLPWPSTFLDLYGVYGAGCGLIAVAYFGYSARQMRLADADAPMED